MKKRMAIITLGILMLASAMAMTIYSGDSYSFSTEQFEYYTVVGNSSNMEGMNIFWENGNTTISFNIRFKPDNFTIILFNQEKEIIIEHHYSGGGSKTKYVEKSGKLSGFLSKGSEIIEFSSRSDSRISMQSGSVSIASSKITAIRRRTARRSSD